MNNTEISQIMDILENVHTEEEILSKSSLIYSSPIVDKKATLENIIRFGNLDVDTLTNEKSKIDKLMVCVSENENFARSYMTKMSNLINKKLNDAISESCEMDKHNFIIDVFENWLIDDVSDVNYIATESIDMGSNQSVAYVIESLELNPRITGRGIITACENVFTNPSLTESHIEQFTNVLKNRIENTVRYEMTVESYHDLPMLDVIESCKHCLKDTFSDNDCIVDKLDKMFDEIEDDLEDEINKFKEKIIDNLKLYITDDSDDDSEDNYSLEELSMNPFNSIYQMTPFPVGSRTVSRTVNNCLNAETDEELIESLNEFGKLLTVCEMFGEEILTEKSDSIMSKAKRNIKKASNKVVHGIKTASKKAHDGKVATKKIIDPMVRFIEKTYDDATMKDLDERKQAVMAQGLKGKAMKVAKWIRDVAIGAIATGAMASMGFTLGTVLAGISLIAYIARNAKLDTRARSAVIKELEDELRITREKIDDSRGDDNKQNKYQLMRIETKLEKELNRVKMHRQY